MIPAELAVPFRQTMHVGLPILNAAIARQDWDTIIEMFRLLTDACRAFVDGTKLANEIYNDERGRPSQYFVHPLDEERPC